MGEFPPLNPWIFVKNPGVRLIIIYFYMLKVSSPGIISKLL
jgi:hypothetical protein